MGNSMEFPPQVLLEVDGRRRVSLGDMTAGRTRYLARAENDGTIILTPAVVVTETELALAGNPELAAQLERAITHPESRVRRGRPTARRQPTEPA